MSEQLEHYGVARRSGRYPWLSGKDPQRSKDILSKIDDLRAKGLNEKDIATELGMNTSELRNQIAWANSVRKEIRMDEIRSRKDRGMSNTAIAEELGMSESSVRNYISQKDKNIGQQLDGISEQLRLGVDEHGYLDVGIGVERQMGISRTKMKAAVAKLKEEGYVEHDIYVRRLTDRNKFTTVRVLTLEKDLEVVKANSDKIRPVEGWTDDGGKSFLGLKPIAMMDWDRIDIRYKEDGGEDKDGVIELRRNVKDLDLGAGNYAQVRIGVGGTHYLKGMAMYADDMPKGIDIIFNTNKPKGTVRENVLKKLKDNDDNPFGATIKRQKGALNIVNEEGDWSAWKSTLSAQFLSKQPTKLVKDRLDATLDKIKSDFDEINVLTNPIVKKHLLEAYNNSLDSKTQHLKTQGLPRTKGHVILPFPEMNANEVYAPQYKNGERVVLVRYPHGGTFELPELTVNNKGSAKNTLKNAIDAIGIHPSMARKLSGADFDGDTVYVIPNPKKQIKVSRSLKELKDFDPNIYQVDYATVTAKGKNTLMGNASNLITDMTIKGARQSEIARAVKYSMVVIDSEKHNLDHKQAAIDNGIKALSKTYQTHTHPVTGKSSKGASTIVSKSKQTVKTKDPVTGKDTDLLRRDRNGFMKPVKLVDYVSNARELSSGTVVENLYADYINKVKSMSNKVAKTTASIKPTKYDKVAAKKYSKEVKSLDAKLNVALLNAPRERQAQIMATKTYHTNLAKDYDIGSDAKKKLKAQALAEARVKTNAKKKLVEVTDGEWAAIQARAISNNKLNQILNNTDMDRIKQLATPKQTTKMSTSKLTRIKTLLSNGYTQAEVAEAIGVSTSAISYALAEE